MSVARILVISFVVVFLCQLSAIAETPEKTARHEIFSVKAGDQADQTVCGTDAGQLDALRRIPLNRGAAPRPVPAPDKTQSGSYDAGDIAVIQDDGTIVLYGAGPVDLQGSSVRFAPTPDGGMDIAVEGAPQLPANPGAPLELTDDGWVLVEFERGFRFPFYGTSYKEVFVNANGYLTFDGPDPFTDSPESFLRAFPRIAPFATDLNPEAAGQVSVLQQGDRVTVLWNDVPEFGAAAGNTFFVALERSGNIEMGFLQVAAPFAPLGITPGGLRPGLTQVDFSEDAPLSDVRGAILELFLPEGTKLLDLASLTQNFYDTHADEYDVVVLWSDFAFDIRAGFAFYQFLQNEVLGIGLGHLVGGDGRFDASQVYGSDGALKGFLNMNFLDLYPDDPETPFLRTNNTLSIMGQEAGHRFGSFVLFDRDPGPGVFPSTELLGRSLAHWSFMMDSEASHLEGNGWEDLGGGTFQSVEATARYSLLDRYLIGLRGAAQVPPFWFIDADPVFSGTIGSIQTVASPPPLPPLDVVIDDAQDFGPPLSLFTNFSSTFFMWTNPGTPAAAPSLVIQNGFVGNTPDPRAVSVFSFFGPLDTLAAPGDPYAIVVDPGAPPQTNLFNAASGSFDGPQFTLTGSRVEVSVDDVVAVEGPRVPVAGVQPREYRQAFLLLAEQDQAPDPQRLEKLERVRAAWLEEYVAATDDEGEVVTTLIPRGKPRVALVSGSGWGRDSGVRLYDTGGAAIRDFSPFKRGGGQTAGITSARLGDAHDSLVVGSGRGQFQIFQSDGTAVGRPVQPFGRGFNHGVRVAASDLDGSGLDEIVAAMAGRGNLIRVFDHEGRFTGVEFEPFSRWAARNGVHVAAGDVDGDGEAEIVVGSGLGAAPRVRVFEGDGTFTGVELVAGSRWMRGGVSVAVGDLDGDGVAEILTAPAMNGPGRINVFDGQGQRVGDPIVPDAVLGGRHNLVGLTIATSDTDLDGMDEVIVGTGAGLPPAFAIYEGDGSLVRGGFPAGSGDKHGSQGPHGGIAVAAGDFEGRQSWP